MTDTDVSGREPTREEIIAFLNGEGMLEDCWFGEKHPSHSGYFWWRKYLNRLRSPGGDGGLVAALRDMPCIRPCNGRPDDFTVGQCCDAGECGCGNAAALSAAEATKDAEDFKQWVAERQPDYKAAATSAPTPAPVSGEREELAIDVEKTADDLDSLSFDFDGDSSQMDAITEAADHLRNYATALRTPHGLPGEEELAIALWADEPAGPETALKWDYESPKRQMKFRHWAQRLISRLTASREGV